MRFKLMLFAVIFGFASCATPSEKDVEKEKTAKAEKAAEKNGKKDESKDKSKDESAKTEAKVEAPAGGNVATCKNDSVERQVSLVYEVEGQKIPCKVTYAKITEEPDNVQELWRADNQEGFCEEKMNFFLEKLQGFGFTCTR